MGRWEKPIRRDDPTIALIQEKGDLHEAEYLAVAPRERAASRRDREGRPADAGPAARGPGRHRRRRCATARTSSSRRRSSTGAGAVTPTSCSSDRTARVPALGSWSYDIADTKLARSVKGGADPADVRVRGPAGGRPGHRARVALRDHRRSASGIRYRTEDFSAYFRYVRARFDARVIERTRRRRGRHLSRPGRPLPRLHLVPRRASSGDATTTTSRSWPGCAASTPSDSRRPACRRWPSLGGPASRIGRSTEMPRLDSSTRVREQARLQLDVPDDARRCRSS